MKNTLLILSSLFISALLFSSCGRSNASTLASPLTPSLDEEKNMHSAANHREKIIDDSRKIFWFYQLGNDSEPPSDNEVVLSETRMLGATGIKGTITQWWFDWRGKYNQTGRNPEGELYLLTDYPLDLERFNFRRNGFHPLDPIKLKVQEGREKAMIKALANIEFSGFTPMGTGTTQ